MMNGVPCSTAASRPVMTASPAAMPSEPPMKSKSCTPTTDDRRLPAVLANTSGFVYYVSITGITGMAAPDTSKVNTAVARIKRHTRLPVAVGFGVKTAAHARAIAKSADGVVVGSALIDALKHSLDKNNKATRKTVKAVTDLVAALAAGVRGAKRQATQ